MDKNDILNTKKCLIGKNLGGALEAIQPLLHDNTYVSLHERISKLTDDYQLMLCCSSAPRKTAESAGSLSGTPTSR